MVRVVILGASFGGLKTAEVLQRLLQGRAEVLVIEQRDRFVFRPSLPWVVFGQRRPDAITRPLAPLLQRCGAGFLHDRVEAIDPDAQTVHTHRGRYAYDFLVMALGGSSPAPLPDPLQQSAHTFIWLDDALALRLAARDLAAGHVVVAIQPPNTLLCPAYEIVFQWDQYLRRRGLRHRVSLSLVSFEPEPFTVGGKAASAVVRRWLRAAGIAFYPSTFITRVERHGRETALTLAGGQTLPCTLLVAVPSFQGTAAARTTPGLTDHDGFVLVDRQLRSLAHQNIFAVGDGVAFPGPKTGLMAELQAHVAARNIAAELALAEPADYRSLLVCLGDFGVRRGLLAIRRPAPGQGEARTFFLWPGWLPHAAKIGFERYYLNTRLRVP